MTTATKKIEIFTTQLRDKTTVFAKNDKRHGICAVTYCNETQAKKMVKKLKAQGVNCHVRCRFPYYVVID